VEKVILLHPAVAEVAVVGLPDKKWGQLVKAVVRLKPKTVATEQEIREYCRKHLASFQVPKSVSFLEELPRESAYGKVRRDELVKMYSPESQV